METLGQFLRSERLKRDLSMSDVAEKINTKPAYISNIENGKNFPLDSKMDILGKLAALFGKDRAMLLELAYKSREAMRLQGNKNSPAAILAREIKKHPNLPNEQLQKILDILKQYGHNTEAE